LHVNCAAIFSLVTARAVQASEGGGKLHVDTLKNNRPRTVPLAAELVPIIER
jgi:hypothetical protein